MDRIAVFGDIHANQSALKAVFDDMDARGLSDRFCLGDLVGYGTFPNEVIAMITEGRVPTLMGNYDQGVGNDSDECGCAYKDAVSEALGKRSIAWTNQNTSTEHKLFLRQLSPQIPLALGDLRVVLAHGSPRKINEYIYEDRPDKSLERLLDLADADILVCGHTHMPYHRVPPSGRHMINAGSVGKPKDSDPRACYVILEASGRELSVSFIRLPYDIETTARAIEVSTMPAEYAQMLRTGTG